MVVSFNTFLAVAVIDVALVLNALVQLAQIS